MHPEVAERIPYMLANGNAPSAEDLKRAFNFHVFEEFPRVRFLSHGLQILNEKLRMALFEWIPPHPSLSVTWILSFILSPFFLFKLIRNLTGRTDTAWTGVLLYVLTPGFLSLTVMLFHPAKPLANFFFILTLFAASAVWKSARERAAGLPAREPVVLTAREARLFTGFLAVFFTTFLTDESAWFTAAAVPILFPGLLLRSRVGRCPAWLLYVLPPVFFLAVLTWGMPALVTRLGYGPYDFWGYLNAGQLAGAFKAPLLALNAYYLPAAHLVPFYRGSLDIFYRWGIPVLTFGLIYSVFLLVRAHARIRGLVLRLVLMGAVFIVFYTFLLLRHSVLYQECWYYGTIFSVILAMGLAVLLSVGGRFVTFLNRLLLVAIMGVFVLNFQIVNERVMLQHTGRYVKAFPDEIQGMRLKDPLTWALITRAWRLRDRPEVLELLKKSFPIKAYWLFVELKHL